MDSRDMAPLTSVFLQDLSKLPRFFTSPSHTKPPRPGLPSLELAPLSYLEMSLLSINCACDSLDAIG